MGTLQYGEHIPQCI